MPGRWLALSVLAAALTFGSTAQAGTRSAAGDPGISTATAGAAQDFSANRKKYVKKQDDGWNRTKKYR